MDTLALLGGRGVRRRRVAHAGGLPRRRSWARGSDIRHRHDSFGGSSCHACAVLFAHRGGRAGPGAKVSATRAPCQAAAGADLQAGADGGAGYTVARGTCLAQPITAASGGFADTDQVSEESGTCPAVSGTFDPRGFEPNPSS
jgi:hypothetical protein